MMQWAAEAVWTVWQQRTALRCTPAARTAPHSVIPAVTVSVCVHVLLLVLLVPLIVAVLVQLLALRLAARYPSTAAA